MNSKSTFTYLPFLTTLVLSMPVAAAIYVQPENGALAQVTLSSNVPHPMNFVVYDDGKECKGRSYVQPPADLIRTVKVRASTPMAFTIGHTVLSISCPLSFRFTPEEGAKYLFTYTKQYQGGYLSGGKSSCQLVVRRVDENGELSTVDNLEKLKTRAPFFESGSWCEPEN